MAHQPRPMFDSIMYVGAVTGATLILGAGAGAGIDGMASAGDDPYHDTSMGIAGHDSFVGYINETDQFEVALKDLEGRDETLIVRFGEACVSAVLPYTDGGLAATEEDSIVSDLLASPSVPCGQEPTDVRQAVHEVREVKGGLRYSEGYNYNERLANIDRINEKVQTEKEDDGIVGGILVGGLLVGSIGLASSLISERDYRRKRAAKAKNPYNTGSATRENGIGLVLDKIFS